MKEATIFPGTKVKINDVDFPTLPSPDHLIIKVIVAGSNPKDWAIAERVPGINQGDDIAGIVHSVGDNVTNFRPGDRVASFHEMLTPHGCFAEYAVGLEATTFHIPPNVSFEEASTIPLAGMTAALGMYQRLGLPLPWLPAQERLPLVVYGAAGAVGAFAVKLATLSNIHPIICVAGRGIEYVESLIDRSKGDTIVDYRQGNDEVVKSFQQALNGEKLCYAFDAVSDKGSYQNLMKVMDLSKGRISLVLARKHYEGIPDSFAKFFTQVGRVHAESYPGIKGEKKLQGLLGDQDFGAVMYKFFERGLKAGWFKGHPYQVVPGGLDGVETGLQDLKAGKASAFKFVFRIEETKGLSQSKL
ncbi:GroES-like protein [Microthyrium microscopicum]|uniref:GroES-like protein n=1 Tax=Microthyrium microscopicum TaxID=703497 RepID=A0A6A6URX4_9PEZI|nr:GroES-like protein [Microthyrium microscopicum]